MKSNRYKIFFTKSFALITLLFVIGCGSVFAATITSTTSGNWNATTISGTAYVPTDNISLPGWTHTFNLTSDVTCASLSILNNNVLNLNGKTLTITGNLTIGQNVLIQVGTGKLIINGNLIMTNHYSNGIYTSPTGEVHLGGNFTASNNGNIMAGGITGFQGTLKFIGVSNPTISLNSSPIALAKLDWNCKSFSLPANFTASSETHKGPCSPSLSASALTSFGNVCTSSTYGPNTFTITGSLLTTANVTVSSLSGYTFSTTVDGSYASSLSLTQPGGSYSQAIYVKFSPTTVQSYNGSIVVSGGGASNINVAASGALLASTDITTQPTPSSSACFNQAVSALSVVASGGDLSYQWYSNSSASNSGGAPINGEIAASFLPPTNSAGTRYYYCIVSGACGNATSNVSTVVTHTAVEVPGAIFSSAACENVGITYQKTTCREGTCYWQNSVNGVSTENSNNTYTVAATTVYLRTYNSETQCWSDAISDSESYLVSPTITGHPSTAEDGDCIGTAHEALSVTVTEHPSVSYQWYSNTTTSHSNGTIIAGATSNSYTPPHTVVDTTYYYCEVTLAATGCKTNSTVSGAVITRALPIASATAGSSDLYSNATLTLAGTPSSMASYAWTGSGSFSAFTSTVQNPVITNPTVGSGTFSLTVTDIFGCVSSSATTATVTVSAATDYYYDGVGDIANVASWGINTAGTEGDPPSFSNPGVTYHILPTTSSTPTMVADWTVSGVGSKIVIGDGANPINFTIPASYALTTSGSVVIDVKNAATLTIRNVTSPSLGSIANGSLIVYNGTESQIIKAADYYNLTISGDRGGATIILEPGTILVSNVFNVNGLSNYNIAATRNTFVFDGTGNQDIPAFTYYNLNTEMGGTKTLAGTGAITVLNKLRVGNISILNGADKVLNLCGSGAIVTLAGKFIPGTSTVNYTSTSNATVAAMNYYNLNCSGGPRTLQPDSVITIAGTAVNAFTPGTGPFTITRSTIKYNGAAAQYIPAFTFNNLTIANTSGDVSTSAPINVQGVLTLEQGILTTTFTNSLTVTNTSVSAVSQGTTTSFVNGPLKRNLPSNLTGAIDEYIFPVGKATTFLPFTINTVTTGSNPSLQIEAFLGDCGGSPNSSPFDISNTEYWQATTSNVTSAKVTLTRQTTLGTLNAIGHCSTINGTYTSIDGSVFRSYSVKNSNVTTFSFFVLATRTSTPVTYSYNCTGNPSLLTSWTLKEGTGDATPASFAIDDATWLFNCDATVTSNWEVSGANSIVKINDSYTLTIDENVTVSILGTLQQEGNITTEVGSTLSVYGTYLHNLAKIDWETAGQEDVFNNAGTFSLYTDITLDDMMFNNLATGVLNVYNSDFQIQHSQNSALHDLTTFNNSGLIQAINSNFIIVGTNAGSGGGPQGAVGYHPKFINGNGAIVVVDNTAAPDKSVLFGPNAIFGDNLIEFQDGSIFTVKKADVEISHANVALDMGGILIVEDGNILTHVSGGGGGTFNITFPSGEIYVYDTDNSGDGLLQFNTGGGGYTMNVLGTLYAQGITSTGGGGGSTINAQNGGTIFIGNLGASLDGTVYQFAINVKNGGVLNYCGNISALGDDVGSLENGSNLNYAESYYTANNPVDEDDFDVVSGFPTIVPLYTNLSACIDAFNYGIENKVDDVTKGLLPIQLTLLYGTCADGIITIVWQTATEYNNDYFTLYRSFDGISFEPIEHIDGAGSSNSLINYNYTDKVSHTPMVYYKLAQTEYDGTTVFSKIIAVVTCNSNTQFNINNLEIQVEFENSATPNHVTITTIDGKIVYSKSFIDQKQIVIPNKYGDGIYVISVCTPETITCEKFINLRKE